MSTHEFILLLENVDKKELVNLRVYQFPGGRMIESLRNSEIPDKSPFVSFTVCKVLWKTCKTIRKSFFIQNH